MYSKEYKLEQTILGGRKNTKFHLGQKKMKEEDDNLNETETYVTEVVSESNKNHKQYNASKSNINQDQHLPLAEDESQSVEENAPKFQHKPEQVQKKVYNQPQKNTYENSGPTNKLKQQHHQVSNNSQKIKQEPNHKKN